LVIPSIHPAISINSSAVNHQPEFTDHCVTPDADEALHDGAVSHGLALHRPGHAPRRGGSLDRRREVTRIFAGGWS
jgi:hypothetical protein